MTVKHTYFFERPVQFAISICAVLGLAACSAPGEPLQMPRPVAVASPMLRDAPNPYNPPAAADAQRYRLDPLASSLHILVYRGGSMARLGHNHVVSSPNLQGTLWRGAALEQSGFEIAVPVNDLIVDDNTARAQEGDEFPLNVSEDAKESTKANMLRPTLLDGAQYPDIRLRSVAVGGTANAVEILASIQIRNQTREVRVPVTLREENGSLQVQGMFEIRQSDFGITPLSIAMGALQVVDAVKIKFVLVAHPIAR